MNNPFGVENRELFVSLVQNSTDFIGFCDATFTPLFVNSAGLAMVGLDNLDEAKRTLVRDFFFPEDQSFIMEEFFPGVVRSGRGEVEIRFRHFKTGETLWMRYSVFALKNAAGETTGYATVSPNITERRAAEAALKLSEQRERQRAEELQALLDTAPVGLAVATESSGKHIRGNRANEDMFGLPHGAEFSKTSAAPPHFRAFQNGREVEASHLPMQRAVRGENVRDDAMEIIRDDGKRFTVLANAAPLLDEARRPRGAVGAFLDITRLKEAEDELRRADARKNEFLAMLAHELRNPLAALRNAINALRRFDPVDALQDDRIGRLFEILDRQSDSLVRHVDDLLDVSRVTTGKISLRLEVFDLRAAIHQAVETCGPLVAAQGHRLELELPETPLPVDGDPLRLAQVFTNLLNNAAKYTPPGGQLRIGAVRARDAAVVRVEDDGMGILPEMLPRIFDLFTQSPRAIGRDSGGLGIGLALSRKLVDMHAGVIEGTSDGPGRGSVFTVRLPLAARQT